MHSASVSEIVAGKRAVIFDLFHTLTALESTWGNKRPPTHAMLGVSKEEWDRQLHECSRERLTGVKKDPYGIVRDMARAISPEIPDGLIRNATDNRISRFAAALIQIPARTQETVRALRRRGQKVGLVSNADIMEVAAWSQCPIRDQFHSTIFSCHAGSLKPEAEIYRQSLVELGVTPSEAVFVGDGGSHELEGAKAVGLTTVMVAGIIREIWPDRIPERKRHADFVIEELFELIAVSEEKKPKQSADQTLPDGVVR